METVYYKQILGDAKSPFGYVHIEEIDIIECYDHNREIRLSKHNNKYYVALPKFIIGLCDESSVVLVFDDKYHLLKLMDALKLQCTIKRKMPEYRLMRTEFTLDDVTFFEKANCFSPHELNELRNRLSPIIRPEIMKIITGKADKIY